MLIRKRSFCALAKSSIFHRWLLSNAVDLHGRLTKHIAMGGGCKSNSEYMMFILAELVNRGLKSSLCTFLEQKFPHMIEQKIEDEQQGPFLSYYPGILTFPSKMIMQNDDLPRLRAMVIDFLRGKVGCDYLIIGNRAYIEYFAKEHAEQAEKVKPEDRDLYKYRKSKSLKQDCHEVPHE